jgi:aminoglycoside phosphotransferase (APT) family kinase protein
MLSKSKLGVNLLEYFRSRHPTKTNVKVSDPVRIASGWETDIYSFSLGYACNNELHSQDLVLRIYPSGDSATKSTREFGVMAKLRDLGFPVPKVHFLETDRSFLSNPFVIMEKINGRTMAEVSGTALKETSEEMNKLFCKMFVDLHRLNPEPFLSDPSIILDRSTYEANNTHMHIANILENFRRTMAHFQVDETVLQLFNQIIGWLEENEKNVPDGRTSLAHLDYHPHNILIRDDGKPFVIDWTNFNITDYRVDLAWTLLLMGTYDSPEVRDCVLETYERISQSKAETIEYFEVIAATRRLGSIYLSLSQGAENLGMRPEAAKIMKQQKNHVKAVIKVLSDRTGIEIGEFGSFLGS